MFCSPTTKSSAAFNQSAFKHLCVALPCAMQNHSEHTHTLHQISIYSIANRLFAGLHEERTTHDISRYFLHGKNSRQLSSCIPQHVISPCSSAQSSWNSPRAAIHEAAALMPPAAEMSQVHDDPLTFFL